LRVFDFILIEEGKRVFNQVEVEHIDNEGKGKNEMIAQG
jgi:hypothetical protein